MMSDTDLQNLVCQIAHDDFQRKFEHQAIFNRRLKTTGGRYHLQSHDLDFNPLVLKHFGLEELKGVIRHELCHYFLHIEGKGYRHQDADFKNLLAKVEGSRYVKSLRPYLSKTLWHYRCRECASDLYRERRFNLQRYVCGQCGSHFDCLGKKGE